MKALLSSLCLLVFAAPAAMAESQIHDYGTGFVNEAAQVNEFLKSMDMKNRGEIVPQRIIVDVVREDYMNEADEFALLLSVPDVTQGCYTLSPLEYEASYIDPYYLDIKVKHYRRELLKTDAPHLDCPGQYSRAQALIPLSRRDLNNRGTQEIKFSTSAATDTYMLVFGDDYVELKPESTVVFQPESEQLGQGFVFESSVQTVELYVPQAQDGDNVAAGLSDFALQKGFLPVQSGGHSDTDDETLLVRDEQGVLGSRLDDNDSQGVGQIYVSRKVRAENGVVDRKVPLTVFAKRP